MKKNLHPTRWLTVVILLAGFVVLMLPNNNASERKNHIKSEIKQAPNDWFFMQRFGPQEKPDPALMQIVLSELGTNTSRSIPGIQTPWTQLGPGNIGGRINCIAIHPTQNNIKLCGSACGGIFKTINNGQNWYPVFDNQSFLSIAQIVYDPQNPSIVYACTGDPNISGTPFIGNGIYKSTDGGESWNYLALSQCGIISDLVIHPTNPAILYAAAMGNPFSRTNDRGLYKSTDGGLTWNQVLFLADDAGISDVDIDPLNPSNLLAAGWNRIRNNQETLIYGQQSRLYRSTNGGQSWTTLSSGLPAYGSSRIGIERSKTNPSKIYTVVVDTTLELQGVYKSINNGVSWSALDISTLDPNVYSGFGWYFGKLAIDPADDDQVFLLSVDLWRFNASGSWEMCGPPWYTYDVHADKHAMEFDNAGNYFLGTDGGMYQSADQGLSWTDYENIPNSQFYRIAGNPWIGNDQSGGMQDNGTSNGNQNLLNNWTRIYGGDGFTAAYSTQDPLVYYAETQNGGIVVSDDGGMNFYDATSGVDGTDRRNWDMVYLLSTHNNQDMYTGTYRVYASSGSVIPNWYPVSPDLTDGVIFGDRFHTISTVEESPVTQGLLYAGTTDGNVWKGNVAGNWINISNGLPDRYVTHVCASPQYPNTIYVSHSGYKDNETLPHIHKSDNQGNTWKDISGDLPNIPVNNILPHPSDSSVLFAATDGGVYITINGGLNWERLGTGMPVVPVFDIALHPVENRLLAGTFARSMMSFPLDSINVITRISAKQTNAGDLLVFPNPAKESFNILLEEPSEIELYHCGSGKKILQNKLQEGLQKILTSSLPAGPCILITTDAKGKTQTRKIVLTQP